jgi:thiamine biosynthesis protein ThiS
MEIIINGQPRQVPEGQRVLDLLASLELDPARLALELDGRILQSSYWGETVLHPGARLEIVHFVGGG